MAFEPNEEQKILKYDELRIYTDEELNNYTEDELKNFKCKHDIPDMDELEKGPLAELCGGCQTRGATPQEPCRRSNDDRSGRGRGLAGTASDFI